MTDAMFFYMLLSPPVCFGLGWFFGHHAGKWRAYAEPQP